MKRIITIGGGEIKSKTTLEIDRYIASLVKERANGGRGNALFIGTASHDSMPYFNSFRKTYTSVFDIKAEVGLMVYGETDMEKIQTKVNNADMIYIGGGDTVYMLEKWKENGFLTMLKRAYEEGKIIAGLSAGAIFAFTQMYSDHEKVAGGEYKLYEGAALLEGCMCPHYNERITDFDLAVKELNIPFSYAVENDCALEFVDGKLTKRISAGGKAYIIRYENGVISKELL